jgi:antitoxin (DNA-binding transcriptional repressor) of toxin-antitoxin stability system
MAISIHGQAQHSRRKKNNLPKLIDRALEGESVVITRHGRPIVELTPVPPAPQPITPEAVDWLIRLRVGRAYAARRCCRDGA